MNELLNDQIGKVALFTFRSGEETSGRIGKNGRTRFRNRTR